MAKQESASKDMTEALPVLAMAMLQKGAGGTDEAAQALLGEFLKDVMEERRAKKERKEAFMKNAVKIAQADAKRRSMEKAMCSHRNQRGDTRLRGQKLSGTGQICLICMFCGDEFHSPALEGQKVPPKDLIPSMDVIGG